MSARVRATEPEAAGEKGVGEVLAWVAPDPLSEVAPSLSIHRGQLMESFSDNKTGVPLISESRGRPQGPVCLSEAPRGPRLEGYELRMRVKRGRREVMSNHIMHGRPRP